MKNFLRSGLAVAVAMALFVAHARADEGSPALAKYDKTIDDSTDKALKFLAAKQQPTGEFESNMRGNTAVTSLCVMAFLAKGHLPGQGPYGQVILKGVDFVLASAGDSGEVAGKNFGNGMMYAHSIATLMLSEVSGMVDKPRQAKIDTILPKALQVILTAQRLTKPPNQQGGWRYTPSSGDSDLSCSGWALMSLRSARNSGAGIPKQAIDEAIKFVTNCRHVSGGFCYQPGAGPSLPMTGVGLLCLELSGRHQDAAAKASGEWILKNLPKQFGSSHFYYALYYASQGMFQLGDQYWENFALHMYEMMLKFQQKDGSWPQGSGAEGTAGPCFSTAIGVLSMSVSYRQLPIYQR